MTPNAIEILIHCHCSGTLPHPRRGAPAVDEELASLVMNNLIERVPMKADCYRTTPRGVAHLRQLCSTPWPVAAWMDQHGNVIPDVPQEGALRGD